jgi:hypothetical protein
VAATSLLILTGVAPWLGARGTRGGIRRMRVGEETVGRRRMTTLIIRRYTAIFFSYAFS